VAKPLPGSSPDRRRTRYPSSNRRPGPVRAAGVAALVLLWTAACGGDIAPAERVLIERQKFEVELISWAPLPDGQLVLDLQIDVQGRSDLEWLTVEVRQVGVNQELLRADPVPLDIAGMEFDGRRTVTMQLSSAGEAVSAVAVLREEIPAESKREDYREFAGL